MSVLANSPPIATAFSRLAAIDASHPAAKPRIARSKAMPAVAVSSHAIAANSVRARAVAQQDTVLERVLTGLSGILRANI